MPPDVSLELLPKVLRTVRSVQTAPSAGTRLLSGRLGRYLRPVVERAFFHDS